MIVLDTNVVSELMRSEPDGTVLAQLRQWPPAEINTSAITVAQVLSGIARLPGGRRREQLTSAAQRVFASLGDRLLAFDARAASNYAAVVLSRERAGAPIATADAQIAALCRSRGATLVTRNVKDFVGTGVSLLDPWQDRGPSTDGEER